MEKGRRMERRPASHTEEEELNQRRRLLNLARKGDPKAINKLFELYQVRVYSGESLGKGGKGGRPITLPNFHRKPVSTVTKQRVKTRTVTRSKRAAQRSPQTTATRRSTQRRPARQAVRRKVSHR